MFLHLRFFFKTFFSLQTFTIIGLLVFLLIFFYKKDKIYFVVSIYFCNLWKK